MHTARVVECSPRFPARRSRPRGSTRSAATASGSASAWAMARQHHLRRLRQRATHDGITGFVKLGGAPSRNVLLGGAINGWSHSDGSATETMTTHGVAVRYLP